MLKAVILIGGSQKGTRFRPLSLDIPKPLFPVAGLPVVQHHIEACVTLEGIKEILLIGFYPVSQFQQFVNDMQLKYHITIKYLQEFTALGTAGGLYHFRDQIRYGSPDVFFVMNGDVCADFPLKELYEFHKERSNKSLVTILGTEATRQQSLNFGCMATDKNTQEVTHYVEKPSSYVSQLINCGIYAFSTDIFAHIAEVFYSNSKNGSGNGVKEAGHIQLEQDILTPLAGTGKMFALQTSNWWSQLKTASSAIYANRHYLELYRTKHPERLTKNSEPGQCKIISDVHIDPTATVHPTAVNIKRVVFPEENENEHFADESEQETDPTKMYAKTSKSSSKPIKEISIDFDISKMPVQILIPDVQIDEGFNGFENIPSSENPFRVVSPLEVSSCNNTNVADKLNLVLENQNKIFLEMALQKTLLQNLAKNLHVLPTAQTRIGEEKYSFPINKMEALETLDLKLREPAIMNEVVSLKKQICGTSGKANGLNCSYFLIDKMITRKLLTSFSWCGGSRKEDPKLPFKIYRNFRTCFFKIIRLADKEYSEADNENFFKNIIKNAKRRHETHIGQNGEEKNGRLSSGKNRPKQLLYKKKNNKNNENDPEGGQKSGHNWSDHEDNQKSDHNSETEEN